MESEILKEIDSSFLDDSLDRPDAGQGEQQKVIEMKTYQGENVVLDLNPNNFEKPKDHLFFDFFSIYAKSFIKDKSAHQRQRQSVAVSMYSN